MLTEKEQKLVKKYCLYPTLGRAAFLTAIGAGGVMILLEMILGVFLSDSGFVSGIRVYAAIAAVYTGLCIYWMFCPVFGMGRKPWKEIVRKTMARQSGYGCYAQVSGAAGLHSAGNIADRLGQEELGDALNAAGNIQGAAAVMTMGAELHANARSVAEACYLEIPSAKNKVLALVLAPILILAACYIPQFRAASQRNAQSQQLAAQTVYALRDSFEGSFADVFMDDPMEEYQSVIGYDVTGYLKDISEDGNSRIRVRVGNDGCIQQVSYTVDVDIHGTKEENLAWADSQIQALNEALNRVTVPTAQPELTDCYLLPLQFREQFAAGSYYEGIYGCGETIGSTEIDYIFATDDEESYDEYSSSTINVFVEAKTENK